MIRRANVTDTRYVMPLIAEAWRASRAYGHIELSDKMLRRTTHDHLANDHSATWLSVRDGEPQGLLAVSISPMDIAVGLAASDDCFYIRPSRGLSTDAVRMIEKYKAWAVSRNCKVINLTVSSGDARADRLISSCGFTRAGGNYYAEAA